MEAWGRMLVVTGVALAVIGALVWWLGRGAGGGLPGDLVIERRGFRLYFPIVTCLVVSAAISLIAWLLRR